MKKIPEIFEYVDISQYDDINIVQNKCIYKFTDDIDNPIYDNKDSFEKIAVNAFISLNKRFQRAYLYNLINYDKCKRLIEEIKSECNNIYSNIYKL